MSRVILTGDFIWMDITPQLKTGIKAVQDVWLNHSIHAFHEDGTPQDYPLESNREIDEAIELGLTIAMEVGYLPKTNEK